MFQGLISSNFTFDINIIDSDGSIVSDAIRTRDNRSELVIIYRTAEMLKFNADIVDVNTPSEEIDIHILIWNPSTQSWTLTSPDGTSIDRATAIATAYLSVFQSPVQIAMFFNYTDQYGVFSMADSRVCANLAETSQLDLNVDREKGAYGSVQLMWQRTNMAGFANSGAGPVETLDIPQGSRRVALPIALPVPAGDVGQMAVNLLTTHGGSRIEQANTVVFVLRGGAEGGVIEFSSAYGSEMRVNEDTGQLRLVIVRRCSSVGEVTVSFSASFQGSGESAPVQSPLSSDDFAISTSSIRFSDGQTVGYLNVDIVNDDIPELDEKLVITVNPGEEFTNGPRSSLSIVIASNDDPHGVFRVSSPELTVQEGQDEYAVVTVLRERGLFGLVQLNWIASGILAAVNADFIPVSTEISFSEGQASADLRVQILDDFISEPAETLTISIVSVNNGARLGDNVSTKVTILAKNDGRPIFTPAPEFVLLQEDQVRNAEQLAYTVTAVDYDVGSNGDVSYSIAAATTCPWAAVGAKNGIVTNNAPLMPWNTEDNCTIIVLAEDNGSPRLSSTQSLNIRLNFSSRCRPGSFSSLGVLPCTPCAVSSYQNEYGSRQCTPCPDGTTTVDVGSESSSSCLSE